MPTRPHPLHLLLLIVGGIASLLATVLLVVIAAAIILNNHPLVSLALPFAPLLLIGAGVGLLAFGNPLFAGPLAYLAPALNGQPRLSALITRTNTTLFWALLALAALKPDLVHATWPAWALYLTTAPLCAVLTHRHPHPL